MSATTRFDLDRAWRLAPEVTLRDEPFGGLAYDFRSRRLTSIRCRVLCRVVRSLGSAPNARAALHDAGVDAIGEVRRCARALDSLATAGMIERAG